MLIYHPAFDAYHCVFRLLVLAESVSNLEVDKARILDFYLMFPAAIASIRLPANLRDGRRLAKSMANIYHDPISTATTFREMRDIQDAAMKCIAASGLIDVKDFEAGFIKRTPQTVPDALKSRVMSYLNKRQPIIDIILNGLADIPLGGHDGLKHRTQLLEYRYDAA